MQTCARTDKIHPASFAGLDIEVSFGLQNFPTIAQCFPGALTDPSWPMRTLLFRVQICRRDTWRWRNAGLCSWKENLEISGSPSSSSYCLATWRRRKGMLATHSRHHFWLANMPMLSGHILLPQRATCRSILQRGFYETGRGKVGRARLK